MNKEFQTVHNMHIALFSCTSEGSLMVCDLDPYDLRDWGYTTVALAERMENLEDISPMEFDSREEYLKVIRDLKEKEESLIVVTADTQMVNCVNYKGEFEKMVPEYIAQTLPGY